MNGTAIIVQPLAYRLWDPKHHSFFYTDVLPEPSLDLLDRWTGLFDKQGMALYENDIVRLHHDWKFGWVRARIVRHPKKEEYSAEATAADGTILRIGFYCFAEGYKVGNVREHPKRLTTAREQFPADNDTPWWLGSPIFPSAARSCFN